MSPDTMPARSWSLPRRVETLEITVWRSSNLIGSDPYLRFRARVRASPSLKSPVIWTVRPVMPWLIVGAEITWLSSTIATF